MNRKIISLQFLLVASFYCTLTAQVPIQYYDFENDSNRKQLDTTAEFVINSISGSTITSKGGVISSVAGNPNSGTAIERANWPTVIGDPGVTTTNYFEFKVNSSGFGGLKVQLDAQATSAILNSAALLYSSDGVNFFSAGSDTVNMLAFKTETWDLSNIQLLDNNSSITFRLYAYSSILTVGVTDSIKIDNLTISADTVTTSTTLGNYQLIGNAESGSLPFFSNFTINGSGIQINLNSDIQFNGTLNLHSGIISTGNYKVIFDSAAVISGGSSASFVAGNLSEYFSGSNSNNFPIGTLSAYRPVYLLISASGSGFITIDQHDQNPNPTSIPSGVSSISTIRYWSFINDPSLSITQSVVRLTWGSDDGITDLSNVTVVFGTAGGSWPLQDNTGAAATGTSSSGTVGGNYFAGLPVDAAFGNLNGGNNPLPVELNFFTGVFVDNNVELKWSTVTEVNNFGFEVERLNPPLSHLPGGEEKEWVKIGLVRGNGNSNSPKQYSFVDNNPKGANEFEYRLKQVDNNGGVKYSKAVDVKTAPADYELFQNYPNPFNPATVINYQLPTDGFVTLKIFDALGKAVKTLVNEYKIQGRYSVDFNAANLASGTYYYQLHSINSSGGNFIAAKKMLLVK